jgi:hypothetical protein
MKDRLLIIFYTVCLVLCFATIVSWARSTVSSEGFSLRHRYAQFSMAASDGAVVVLRGHLVFADDATERAWRAAVDPGRNAAFSQWRPNWARDLGSLTMTSGTFFGFGYYTTTTDSTRRIIMPGVKSQRTILQIPHWFFVMLFGLGPGYWFFRREQKRRSRLKEGLCRRCGFVMGDVYHSCPKCGERAPLPEGFSVIAQD